MHQDKTDTITINLPSEIATLKTVVMCYANRGSIRAFLKFGRLDVALFYQARYNKFGRLNLEKAHQQQKAFIELLKANGVDVLFAAQVPDCIAQQYTRDIGFAIEDTFFLANPRRYSRQREQEGLRDLLPRFSKVAHLESGTIEGGDVIVDEKYVIVGLGEETSKEGIACLRRKLGDLGINREIVVIEFSHRGTIHLDTKFNIPAKGIGVIHPKSFKPESLKWFENHFDLIEATEKERLNLEINTFTISPQKVVMLSVSERLAARLASKGIEPILIDYSELTKHCGSFRCTTLPIERI